MLELRQEQKLLPILTQQLQQAIKLLQLNQIELVDAIEQEVQENPVLEVSEEPSEEQQEERSDDSDDIAELLERYSASEDYIQYEEKEYFDYENVIQNSTNLRDHLRWQVGLLKMSPDERIHAEWVIENIDDNGYLAYPLSDIATASEIPLAALNIALNIIQSLEPSGVGARDLKECILLQYKAAGELDPIFIDVVTRFFDLFQRANLKDIAKKSGYTVEKIKSIIEHVKTFDPKPGRNFSDDRSSPVTPDVYVVKGKDDFEIFLNEDEVPDLKLSKYYLDLYRKKNVGGDTRRYIKQKIKQAQWFIKSIEQRQRTLYLVSKSIVTFQRDFLEKGIRHLKPLNLRDVALEVNVHESTVSRVTTNKYMSTPQGLYEMKFFFPTGVGGSSTMGDNLSSNVVMDLILEMVSQEDKSSPLTDEGIVIKLKAAHNINLARRTVVKYREILHIPSSRTRKSTD